MNTDEIVMWLRQNNRKSGWTDIDRMMDKSADLIESLQAQLAASQRRERAAVEDIYKMMDGGECDICKHYNPDKNTCAKPFVPYDDCFEWRGAQKAGEGGRDETL